MSNAQKTVLVGVLAILAGLAWKFLSTPTDAEPLAVVPGERSVQEIKDKWAKLMNADDSKAPDGASKYADERWAGMEEPMALPGADPSGERYVIFKKAVVGRMGNGKPVYAVGLARPHRFEGPLYKASNNPGHVPVRATIEGFEPQAKKWKFGKLDLDDLPDHSSGSHPTQLSGKDGVKGDGTPVGAEAPGEVH
jgi:hypothetical protein